MLELKDITTGYNGTPLHSSFSTSAKAGELIILAGRNGAGKSTLIQKPRRIPSSDHRSH